MPLPAATYTYLSSPFPSLLYRREIILTRGSVLYDDRGSILFYDLHTEPYDRGKFIASLHRIRELTSKQPEVFEPKMKELCREAGVALVFAYEMHDTHLFGATRWLTPEKALIILSLRYKTDDHFWFSFFHEAGHILHHGKKNIFLDEKEMTTNEKEKEADRFATKILIPDDKYQIFVKNINNKQCG